MKKILVVIGVLHSFLAAVPPPLPSAGVVEREIEKEYEGKPLEIEKEIPSVEVEIPEEKFKMDSTTKVYVRKIQIEGNKVISEATVQKWVEKYLDRKLTMAEIYEVCQIIDKKYMEKGYFLIRCYPPPQSILRGVLVIRVLEGRIGTIRIEGNKYYSTKFIARYFEPFCHKTLQYDKFLKALLLLNENSDLQAGVVFEKGKQVGTTDLLVRVKDTRPIHLYLNENNYGRDLTTNSQLGGRLDWGSCILQGDTFSVAQVVGFPINALYFTDATYTVPLNTIGTSMEVAYLFSQFKIEELRELKLKGQSMIGTVKANHALTRTKTLGIDLFGYFDFKQIKNFTLGHTTSSDRLRVVTVGALIDHYNAWQGRDYLNVRASAGIPDFLGGMPAKSRASSRIGGGGQFYQVNLDYDRIQRLYKEWVLYFHASGQWSPNKLTLPQQLYIGGSNTVRGYPLSVALGDSGYYANFETRFPLPIIMNKRFFWTKKTWRESLQLVGFVDTGATFFNNGPHTYITGAGFGFRILGPYSFSLSFDLGFPLLHHHELSKGKSPWSYLKLTANPF